MTQTIRVFADNLTYAQNPPLEQPIKILIAGDRYYKVNIQWEDFITDGELLIDVCIPTSYKKQVRISAYRITQGEYNFSLKKFTSTPNIEEIPVRDSLGIINPYLALFPVKDGLSWTLFTQTIYNYLNAFDK